MPRYRFAEFEFDSATGELRKTGGRVRLRPQPARALEHLLERPGEFVSRAELQRAIWPDGTFVHFDHGLNSCMKQIRAALGDNRFAPCYVETLVKRGFRFLVPVVAGVQLSSSEPHLSIVSAKPERDRNHSYEMRFADRPRRPGLVTTAPILTTG